MGFLILGKERRNFEALLTAQHFLEQKTTLTEQLDLKTKSF